MGNFERRWRFGDEDIVLIARDVIRWSSDKIVLSVISCETN